MTPDENYIRHLKLENTDDLSTMQIYLIDALEDLTNLDTLCAALKLTSQDLEDIIEEEK